MTGTDAAARAGVLPLARRAVAYEAAMWRCLYRWVFRRPAGLEPGAEAFGYTGVVLPILMIFIILSTVEIPLLDLILRHVLPWDGVRVAALALGVYGVLWMVGLLAMLRVNPHVVGPAGLRVRNGASIDLVLPWDAVTAVRKRYRALPSNKSVQFEGEGAGRVLVLGLGGQTSVDVVLGRPMVVPLPKAGGEPVGELRIYADDPDALVAKARTWLTAPPPDGAG
ncbi:MAG TPA: hypothetical protein VES42_16775 [Pilimelia sp.]|nr:hypothetical protein [Pilimelia sp.]